MKQTHGHTVGPAGANHQTRTYRTWASMIQRCTNEHQLSWKQYGAKGIRVCKRWMKFENFLSDMGTRPLWKTLDRKDGKGNYTPSNCRWATPLEQRLNSSQVRWLTFRGKTLPLKHWANAAGLKRATVSNRILYRGWSVERALTTTVEQGRILSGKAGSNMPRDPKTGRTIKIHV